MNQWEWGNNWHRGNTKGNFRNLHDVFTRMDHYYVYPNPVEQFYEEWILNQIEFFTTDFHTGKIP